jgi:hypothetical protein
MLRRGGVTSAGVIEAAMTIPVPAGRSIQELLTPSEMNQMATELLAVLGLRRLTAQVRRDG